MEREVGGNNESPDWPKLGPSMLIGTFLILAIRTAKWPPKFDPNLSNHDLQQEIDYAAHLAGRVLSSLMSKREGMFPPKRTAWYQPLDEDVPK